MRATVLTDKALAKHAGRFVWLSIDTENEKNAKFLQAYAHKAVPTFYVIDPADGHVAYTWIGGVDTAALLTKFDEGEHAMRAAAGPATPAPDSVDAIYELGSAGKNDECAQRALALLPSLAKDSNRANMAMTGLDCALSAGAGGVQGVDLAWDPSPSFKEYRISRDGVPLALVEDTGYRDDGPPAGLRTYQVVGIAEKLHSSPPRECAVEVPGAAGETAAGRVVFADSAATPIGSGRVTLLDATGAVLGRGQPQLDGRFEIALRGGPLAGLLYQVTVPALGDADPRAEHSIQVAAKPAPEGGTEIRVPVPVLAVCGDSETPSRWSALLGAIEDHVLGQAEMFGTYER